MKVIFFLMFLSLGTSLYAAEKNANQTDDWSFLKDSFSLMFESSYTQFTTKSNLYISAAAAPAILYGFEEDRRVQTRYGGTEIKNIVDHVGDAGVVFNFPLIHLGFYYYGKKKNNPHHMQFAKEYFAAMYLALAESGLLSYVNVHSRPVTRDLSFWESEFRGKSSWPSGHVIPYMSLFWKTLQFYGPAWSALPFAFSILASMQRVQDQKHWQSDIITSFFVSAWASEGVRKAAGYKKNHPFYKWAFESEAKLGILRHKSAVGPMVVWNF